MKTNNLSILFLVLMMLSPIAAFAQIGSGSAFSMEKSVVANGGGTSSNGAFSVTGTTGQNAAGKTPSNSAFLHQSGFWVNEQLSPTAAAVSVGGQVKNANGSGIRNAVITLIAPNGSTRTVLTSSFGYFRFTEVEVGRTYILTIFSKRFSFTNPSQIISPMDELTDIEFVSQN